MFYAAQKTAIRSLRFLEIEPKTTSKGHFTILMYSNEYNVKMKILDTEEYMMINHTLREEN